MKTTRTQKKRAAPAKNFARGCQAMSWISKSLRASPLRAAMTDIPSYFSRKRERSEPQMRFAPYGAELSLVDADAAADPMATRRPDVGDGPLVEVEVVAARSRVFPSRDVVVIDDDEVEV